MGLVSRFNSNGTLITSVGTLNSADDTALTSVGALVTSVGTLDSANDTALASVGTLVTASTSTVTALNASVGTLVGSSLASHLSAIVAAVDSVGVVAAG
ncbi:MAG: hypothetical protein GY851_03345 [bacterium]|nr:hypothetical protein [bacterium]